MNATPDHDVPPSAAPESSGDAPIPAPLTAHDWLRQARTDAGLSLDALALALKVPVKRLASLEAGRYEELPDMTFARALAMSECRLLGIDPAPILQRMPPVKQSALGQSGVVGGDAMYRTDEGLALSPVLFVRRPPFLIAMALVLAAALLYAWPKSAPTPEKLQTLAPQSEATLVLPTVLPAPVVAPVPTPTESRSAPLVSVPVPEVAPVTPVAPERTAVLRLSAQSETWAEVIRPDGTVLLSRLLKAGDVVDLGSAPPYTVVLGRANAAQVFVRGQSIVLAPHTRGDVVRYEVK